MISYIPLITKWMVYFGKNSLFIMVTHEYLMIRTLIAAVINILMPALDTSCALLFTIFILIIVEVVLCKYIKPIFDKCVGKIGRRIEVI